MALLFERIVAEEAGTALPPSGFNFVKPILVHVHGL